MKQKQQLPVSLAQTQQEGALLLNQKLNLNSDNWLADFVEESPNYVHVKDVQNGKYLLCNQRMATSLGCESTKDFIGLTADDLPLKANFKNNPACFSWHMEDLERIKNIEHQVNSTLRPYRMNHMQIRANGFIALDYAMKFPIPDASNKKNRAIVTYVTDITHQVSLLHMLDLYLQYHAKPFAIPLLLKYLKIDYYFAKPPTPREMEILLAMSQESTRKLIAKRLNICYNTIASHCQHMREWKLRKPDLHEVLFQLHRRHINENIEFDQ
jgi:hypothetical protein